ncbi:MAG: VacJ family lipoprotein [Alphaproteobacteria bacterium]|nr:VacJ family lipoprotein [Alphaproteobacteria bacterium]
MNNLKKIAVLSFVLLTSACATNIHRSDENADPYENINRKIFSFNDSVYENVFFPVARGYRTITTPSIRERVNSFIANIDEPISAVNHLLQLEPLPALKNVARFVINTTLGLAGTFDVAQGWGLKPESTGFNQTMASWCVADGPYVVLPFVGGRNVRGTVGLAVDTISDPVFLATYNDANVYDKVHYPYAALKYTAKAENYMDIYNDFKKNSVDFYATMRSAYLQSQRNLKCRFAPEETTASYDFDFDENWEE